MGTLKTLIEAMDVLKFYCNKKGYTIIEDSDNTYNCVLKVDAKDKDNIEHEIYLKDEDGYLLVDECYMDYSKGNKTFYQFGNEIILGRIHEDDLWMSVYESLMYRAGQLNLREKYPVKAEPAFLSNLAHEFCFQYRNSSNLRIEDIDKFIKKELG